MEIVFHMHVESKLYFAFGALRKISLHVKKTVYDETNQFILKIIISLASNVWIRWKGYIWMIEI